MGETRRDFARPPADPVSIRAQRAAYKIPAATDVPPVLHCELFPNDDNTETVGRSKAVGEPPLTHVLCVWAAVKNALNGLVPGRTSDLRLPATGEEILRCITALVAPERVETRPATAAPASS